MEIRAIRESELEECLDFWGEVFARVGRDYFPPYFYGDPWFKLEYTRVAIADGRIVSTIQICERRVRIGESEIVMGGIGNVGTHPDYRGRGYSTELLKDSIGVMKESGMDISVLFTGIQPFYERLGWQAVPVEIQTGELIMMYGMGPESHVVRPCDWETDLDNICAAYDAFNAGRSMTTVRTREYWEKYVIPRLKPEDTLTYLENGEFRGYMFLKYDEENCWLHEIGYMPEHRYTPLFIIREVSAFCRCRRIRNWWTHLPQEKFILEAFKGEVKRVRQREPAGMMCRLINLESLGERILPELSRRVGNLPPIAVRLETEEGKLPLSIEDGVVTLGAKRAEPIELSGKDLFTFLFGIKGAASLESPISTESRMALGRLFPRTKPAFYRADHF